MAGSDRPRTATMALRRPHTADMMGAGRHSPLRRLSKRLFGATFCGATKGGEKAARGDGYQELRNMDVSSATTSIYSFDKSGRFTGSTTDTKLSGSYNETRAGERKRKEEAAKVASLREQGLTDDEIRTELEREAAQRRNEMNMMEKAGDMIAGAWLSMNNTLGQWGRDVAAMVSEFGEKAGNFFAHGQFATDDERTAMYMQYLAYQNNPVQMVSNGDGSDLASQLLMKSMEERQKFYEKMGDIEDYKDIALKVEIQAALGEFDRQLQAQSKGMGEAFAYLDKQGYFDNQRNVRNGIDIDYDKNGNIIKTVENFSENGKTVKDIVHIFDNGQSSMMANFYDSSGSNIFETQHFKYDMDTGTYDYQYRDTKFRDENGNVYPDQKQPNDWMCVVTTYANMMGMTPQQVDALLRSYKDGYVGDSGREMNIERFSKDANVDKRLIIKENHPDDVLRNTLDRNAESQRLTEIRFQYHSVMLSGARYDANDNILAYLIHDPGRSANGTVNRNTLWSPTWQKVKKVRWLE